MAPSPWKNAKPGSGGVIQNAKAQPNPKQAYGKGGGTGTKYPSKKGGLHGDNAPKRKSSPLARKGK